MVNNVVGGAYDSSGKRVQIKLMIRAAGEMGLATAYWTRMPSFTLLFPSIKADGPLLMIMAILPSAFITEAGGWLRLIEWCALLRNP